MVCGWEGEVLQLVLPVSQILVVGVCIRACVSAKMKVITVIIHCQLPAFLLATAPWTATTSRTRRVIAQSVRTGLYRGYRCSPLPPHSPTENTRLHQTTPIRQRTSLLPSLTVLDPIPHSQARPSSIPSLASSRRSNMTSPTSRARYSNCKYTAKISTSGPRDARYVSPALYQPPLTPSTSSQSIAKPLNNLISEIILSPALITTIRDTRPGDAWLPLVAELEEKIHAVRVNGRVKAAHEMGMVVEGLKAKVRPNISHPFPLPYHPSILPRQSPRSASSC